MKDELIFVVLLSSNAKVISFVNFQGISLISITDAYKKTQYGALITSDPSGSVYSFVTYAL